MCYFFFLRLAESKAFKKESSLVKAACPMSFENGRCGDYSFINWEPYGKKKEAINIDTILMEDYDLELVRLTRERRN